jgi:2-hydroxy-4-carboxymuconate semialdehyde hemiacetal dehydrogenase
MAMSAGEGRDLVDLARARDRFLMVAQSERFIPSLAAVRNRVAAGDLQIYHLMGREACLRRENAGWTGRPRTWTDSLLWHFGGHAVDFCLWMLGADQAEILSQGSVPDPRTGVPMDIDIMLRTPAQQLVSLSLSFHSHLPVHEYLIVAEEESLHFDQGRLTGPEGIRDDPAGRGEDYYRLSWEVQDREFLSALREQRPPAVDGASVLPTLAILQEIEDLMLTAGRA